MTEKVTVIAEAGVNHNGSLDVARQLIDVAAEAGADYVKFQTFSAEKIASRFAEKAPYQKSTTKSSESQQEMLRKLELSEDDHVQLIKHCRLRNIKFLSSPFDLESIDLLKRLQLTVCKVPSGEITNLPYLRRVATSFNEIILSTGVSELDEIKDAITVLKQSGFRNENLTVLHCNTEYPTPFEDVNLIAMVTMKEKLNVKIGYSDHTKGLEVPVAAVALGATVIEKHFTLDRNMDGPDHRASLEPSELRGMVAAIRNIEKAIGKPEKKVSPSEMPNRRIARKSIVAATNILAGDLFTESNLTVKRPGDGVNPMMWDQVIGTRAKRDFQPDEPIEI
jgi:N,N'-diacetyllegionaminate synthase